jgi:CubicO group peptidase (beta-lactamase class C family)
LAGCGDEQSAPAPGYRYAVPPALDEWPVASLDDVGIDVPSIVRMVDRIHTAAYAGIDSVLLVRDGRLTLEEYFHGASREDLIHQYSANKSVVSILTGIALDRGLLSGTDDGIFGYFPEYASYQNWDAWKQAITIRHLLTMTAGTAHRQEPFRSIWLEDDSPRDWLKFYLDLPMAHEPGTVFDYSTQGVTALGAIVASAGSTDLVSFAHEYLFQPLRIEFQWTFQPRSTPMRNSGFYMTARSMAKVGQLMLDEGRWEGRAVVSRGWVEQSLYARVVATGSDPYAYLWWKPGFSHEGVGLDVSKAFGNGGQCIYVVPELRLVAVFTGSSYEALDNGYGPPDSLMRSDVLPAVR